MKNFKTFLEISFLNNTIYDYLILFSLLFVAFIFKRLISKYFSKLIYKMLGKRASSIGLEKFNELLIKPISLLFMLSMIYIAFNGINISSSWLKTDNETLGFGVILSKSFSLVYVISFFWIIMRLIDYVGLILIKKANETENKMDDQLIPFAIEILKILAIIFALFIILSNVFNVNITALATGLGIGGLAFAMASKESLENLLGSFTIFFDRPFTVGDIVTVGSVTGTVEKVGFRSSRIRTFDKSIVTVPNKKMIDAELDNLGMRPVRRVKFSLGLTYETSIAQIKKIVSDIQQMIDKNEKTTQDTKVRFQEFGSSSLDILIIYYVNSPKWDDLIDVKQEINYEIMEIVKNNKSDFAFPSTTVYLQNN